MWRARRARLAARKSRRRFAPKARSCDGDCQIGECCPIGWVDSESDTEDSPPDEEVQDTDESDSESLTVPGTMARFARECRVDHKDSVATDGSDSSESGTCAETHEFKKT